MTVQTASFDMPPVMKSEDCQRLDAFLQAHHDQPVTLNCALVTRIGGQGAQVLAAHIKFRLGSEHILQIDAPSDAFASSLATLGLTHLTERTGAAA